LKHTLLLQGESSIRRRLPTLVPVLLLAFAVFAWGLQYKLSLYHSETRQTGVPEAKLLSPKERLTAPLETVALTGSLFIASNRNIVPTAAAFPSHSFFGAELRIDGLLQSNRGSSAPQFPLLSSSNPRAPPLRA